MRGRSGRSCLVDRSCRRAGRAAPIAAHVSVTAVETARLCCPPRLCVRVDAISSSELQQRRHAWPTTAVVSAPAASRRFVVRRRPARREGGGPKTVWTYLVSYIHYWSGDCRAQQPPGLPRNGSRATP